MADLENPLSDSNSDFAIHPDAETHFPTRTQVQAKVIFGEVTYFALTKEQIDTYATLSWIVTIILTLAAFCLELAFGTWIALEQEVLTLKSETTLLVIIWVAGVTFLVLGIVAGILIFLKIKNQRGWLMNTVELG